MYFRKMSYMSLLLLLPWTAFAEEHRVTAQATKFDPLVVFIEPGDTVVWTNMVGHNADAMKELIPEGAEVFNIPLGENGSVTLEKEGVYVYKCTPHYALGMVGAIVVGEPTNIDSVVANATGMSKRAAIKTRKAIEKKGK